jgi:hypothetical protein
MTRSSLVPLTRGTSFGDCIIPYGLCHSCFVRLHVTLFDVLLYHLFHPWEVEVAGDFF